VASRLSARPVSRSYKNMPAIAHMICHSCGAHSEGLASRNGSKATPCRCGGTRQVVRIARHPWGAAAASPEALERNFQERADDETLTPVPKAQETGEPATGHLAGDVGENVDVVRPSTRQL
jgi:hypothetical protein